MLRTFAALSIAALSTSAWADTESSSRRLAVRGTGSCPASVFVTMRGDSFATGVRFTVVTNEFIAPGARLQSANVNATTVSFTAPLKASLASCVGATESVSLYAPTTNYIVRFGGGKVSVVLRNASPSLRIDLTSTYNNQAIFDLSEIL